MRYTHTPTYYTAGNANTDLHQCLKSWLVWLFFQYSLQILSNKITQEFKMCKLFVIFLSVNYNSHYW